MFDTDLYDRDRFIEQEFRGYVPSDNQETVLSPAVFDAYIGGYDLERRQASKKWVSIIREDIEFINDRLRFGLASVLLVPLSFGVESLFDARIDAPITYVAPAIFFGFSILGGGTALHGYRNFKKELKKQNDNLKNGTELISVLAGYNKYIAPHPVPLHINN